jgi:Activator of Hsp90 ATPase homolog 1-like protein
MNDGQAMLRIERTFDAPVGEVFEAWTSTEVLRRWLHAEQDWETPQAEVDLRVGGAIEVTMRNPRDGTEYTGKRRVHRGTRCASPRPDPGVPPSRGRASTCRPAPARVSSVGSSRRWQS